MRLAAAVLLCSWCYATCSGQTDVPAEPGIAVNGQPLLAGELEKGHKFYEYYFQDQEILSVNVINNETYELTDCFEDSRDPCWLPEGRMFLKERPEQTYCCMARHQDPARTTRLSVTVRLHDENMAEIRLWQEKWHWGSRHCSCKADKQVVGRALRVSVKLQKPRDVVYSVRCRDETRSGNDKIDHIVSQNFTKESSNYFVTFPNSTLNEKGRWRLRCTFYMTQCVYRERNPHIMWDDGPGCWFKSGGYFDKDNNGVSCTLNVDVMEREDVLPPAGYLGTNETQFPTARTHAYYFTEGQLATFYCNRTVDGFAQLTYTDKAGNVNSTQFHQQGPVMLSLQLTAAANGGTFLECTIADVMYEDYLRIRVRLLPKPEDRKDP